ncbi:MAG: hypothetical protein AVDCRST_MAG52-1331, partial [uncultured Blastococcus sp.]
GRRGVGRPPPGVVLGAARLPDRRRLDLRALRREPRGGGRLRLEPGRPPRRGVQQPVARGAGGARRRGGLVGSVRGAGARRGQRRRVRGAGLREGTARRRRAGGDDRLLPHRVQRALRPLGRRGAGNAAGCPGGHRRHPGGRPPRRGPGPVGRRGVRPPAVAAARRARRRGRRGCGRRGPRPVPGGHPQARPDPGARARRHPAVLAAAAGGPPAGRLRAPAPQLRALQVRCRRRVHRAEQVRGPGLAADGARSRRGGPAHRPGTAGRRARRGLRPGIHRHAGQRERLQPLLHAGVAAARAPVRGRRRLRRHVAGPAGPRSLGDHPRRGRGTAADRAPACRRAHRPRCAAAVHGLPGGCAGVGRRLAADDAALDVLRHLRRRARAGPGRGPVRGRQLLPQRAAHPGDRPDPLSRARGPGPPPGSRRPGALQPGRGGVRRLLPHGAGDPRPSRHVGLPPRARGERWGRVHVPPHALPAV